MFFFGLDVHPFVGMLVILDVGTCVCFFWCFFRDSIPWDENHKEKNGQLDVPRS